MKPISSNDVLTLIYNFIKKINQGLLDKKTFHRIINSNLKMNLKKIVSLIAIDTQIGNWNVAQQDARYLIHDIQKRILNGYCIVGKRL